MVATSYMVLYMLLQDFQDRQPQAETLCCELSLPSCKFFVNKQSDSSEVAAPKIYLKYSKFKQFLLVIFF